MFKGKLRWGILTWLFLVVLLSYFDRVNFSMAAPSLMKEIGLNATQLGLVMSAFTFGYAILNFPGGFLAERFTSRKTITVIIFLWSIMTILTGFAWSFASLLLIRILFGMSEGPMGSANTKIVRAWMLPSERATASGLWLSAMPLGACIGSLISAPIITKYGWHSVFYIFGITGFLVAFLTWKILCDKPQDHPSIVPEELESIQTSIAAYDGHVTLMYAGSTVGQLLKNKYTWIIFSVYFTVTMFGWANLNWLPTYFIKARGSDLIKSGLLSALPWIACALGPIVLGWLSDRTDKKYRSPWVAMCLLISVPFVVYGVLAPSITACLICFMIAFFFNYGALGIMWALPMELFESADSVKVSGMMLAFGSVAGFISPYLVGYILQTTNSFNMAYYIFAGIAFVGSCLAWTLFPKEKSNQKAKVSRAA